MYAHGIRSDNEGDEDVEYEDDYESSTEDDASTSTDASGAAEADARRRARRGPQQQQQQQRSTASRVQQLHEANADELDYFRNRELASPDGDCERMRMCTQAAAATNDHFAPNDNEPSRDADGDFDCDDDNVARVTVGKPFVCKVHDTLSLEIFIYNYSIVNFLRIFNLFIDWFSVFVIMRTVSAWFWVIREHRSFYTVVGFN